MPRPPFIELGSGRHAIRIPILYEDRAILAIDKPAGWLLVPFSWQRTQRNLAAALTSSIAAGDFWARSRGLRFLRHVHRLDAETSGVLLLARSQGALNTYSELFESRQMEKTYLAVVRGIPRQTEWTCRAKLQPDPRQPGRMRVSARHGKEAETVFRLLRTGPAQSLLEVQPFTGRTHQIRLHLIEAGLPIVGDPLYGPDARTEPPTRKSPQSQFPMGLRAIRLSYRDPFQRRPISIEAPIDEFLRAFGFAPR